MANPDPRTHVELLPEPREQASCGVVTLAPPAPAYTCSVCGSAWQYQEIRNTGRCPACGSGLLRNVDWS